MAQVITEIYNIYKYLNDDLADPRTKDWFTISTPLWPLAVISGYLYFVTKLGPKWMENRKPFQIDNIVMVYNALQVVFCAYLVYVTILYKGFTDLKYECQSVDYSNSLLATLEAKYTYYYYLLKYLDLFDTLFFVLRKRNRQITFLHLYHHVMMITITWYGVKYVAGGHSTFIGSINSVIHTIMYSYYLYAIMNKGSKDHIWWKKYVTQLQIIQFLVMFWHGTKVIFMQPCNIPKTPFFAVLAQDLIIFTLFINFYRKTYLK